MRTIYLHQKNPVSFSYQRNKISKSNFESFMSSKVKEDHAMIHDYFDIVDGRSQRFKPSFSDLVFNEPNSKYLNFIHDNIYHHDDEKTYAFCSASDLHRSYFLYDEIYHFLIKHLHMNFFDLKQTSSSSKVTCIETPVHSITSTFHPEDSLEINDQDYYQVWIRGFKRPLYLGMNTRIYDDNGNQKTLLDILYNFPGKRRILGLTSAHKLCSYEIERVKNLNRDLEPIDELDTPFYSYQIKSELSKLPILIDHILMDLD
jgi:hypothetical protein